MKGLKDKLNETNLGNSNSSIKNNNMKGLVNKLDQTYLDGSPGRYDAVISNNVTSTRKYDALNQYTKTPEGAIRGQGNLLELFEKTKSDGLLNNPVSPYTSRIGSEVITINTSTPYNSEKTYSDQFRAQGDETLLNRTIDKYL
jgi:hypothetical protein